MLGTLVLFFGAALGLTALWNRFFDRVRWRSASLLLLVCSIYQAPTLFTTRSDIRGSADIYPWKAAGVEAARSNTGIVMTQLAPWTIEARRQLLSGELPLWNRNSASGAPLLANQQTAIFHPFTLLGLPLSIGRAFTLSAALRVYTLLFFTFVLLRGWHVGEQAAMFGAIAYAFSTFHVIWLLFPLGLATMMLPVALAGAQRIESRAGYVLLVTGLAGAVLGGHPESALWVWIVTASYLAYERRRILFAGTAFAVAMLISAFSWYPTLRALEMTGRYAAVRDRAANPAGHSLSAEWLLPFVTPNVLGNPVDGTYRPPRGSHAAVINDYGEVASSYPGLITLGLAVAAPFVARRKPLGFALGLMAFAFLTVAEVPLWRDVVRSIPFAGISIHQRLRVFWDLGACVAAALALDSLANTRPRTARASVLAVAAAYAGIYLVRQPPFLREHVLAMAQLCVPLASAALFAFRPAPTLAALLVFADLSVATWRYNPPTRAQDIFPETGAIRFLKSVPQPARMTAWGWAFQPDTPGAYRLEDVKGTDPIQHRHYMFMLAGYLDLVKGSPDQMIGNVERPFFDYLNVRHLYLAPGEAIRPAGMVERYRGPDGVVLENVEALPRYFLVRSVDVVPDTGAAIYVSRGITDFRDRAIASAAPFPGASAELAGGQVRVLDYAPARTLLEIDSRGLSLLVSSDVHWPGWRAYWNGVRKDIVTVNGAFVGVFVPPGRGRLELRYRPREVDDGLVAAAAGLLLLTLMTRLMPRGDIAR